MEIPIHIAGEKAGVLEVNKEGLYTVFEARLPATKELTRLWVAGSGQSAYLGLMEPKGSEQHLRRRLTAAEMKKLPGQIEYACTEEPIMETLSAEAAPAPEEQPEPEGQEAGDAQPLPMATGPPAEDEGLLWFSRPDGSLVSFDGRSHLLALPARLRQVPTGLRLLRIGEREYLVFRT